MRVGFAMERLLTIHFYPVLVTTYSHLPQTMDFIESLFELRKINRKYADHAHRYSARHVLAFKNS